MHTYWPFAALRMTTPQLELRQPNDGELVLLADVAAKGISPPGQRTFLTPWTEFIPAQRGLAVMQSHWSSKATWNIHNWALELAVFREGQPVGMVTLRSQQFPILREVKTSAWLGLEFQGRGYGTEARGALLHFAFEQLGAEAALSEVFQDNLASQGVSRKLGYQFDGISRAVLDGQPVVSDRLRLTRAQWLGVDHPLVVVSGIADCRPFFLTDGDVS
ncbi:GNAT family N-acetyltransferase [Deinococcus sonorensis]|uniref:GNAT family N-acetyltransferase n=2 Tax=Deinococcus sonorensis TaxID=309891 RepID=A0AAU7U624_9DEIO